MTTKRRNTERHKKVVIQKEPGDAYRLSKEALNEVRKVIRYNDACEVSYSRVQRSEVIRMLEQYGWSGSVHSFNRLIHANFGRSFTGASAHD